MMDIRNVIDFDAIGIKISLNYTDKYAELIGLIFIKKISKENANIYKITFINSRLPIYVFRDKTSKKLYKQWKSK